MMKWINIEIATENPEPLNENNIKDELLFQKNLNKVLLDALGEYTQLGTPTEIETAYQQLASFQRARF